ncbi:MAG TPA: HAMP domain-containing sensor histidine kinase [Cellulomonas sp.]|uniref:sensor histidine kinase n=1 Tax=Cellulomonas sp. TaxID=40001 RepID=UPI002E3254C0|nr:HAMP domain-containing sensor histidine kinase [Cellulomonas sp.]HEX5332585.1 HAMP domain-containing sensor histidine kinase [Cellulomonas sp.]
MTGRSPRMRWTLRRRIVAVLILLLAAFAGTMGVVSTLALRGSLIGQLDTRLVSASERAAHAPTRAELTGTAGLPTTPVPTASPTRPFGLRGPGQDVGTINLDVTDGVVIAGYLKDNGDFQRLTDAQATTLAATPADGIPRTVTIDGLGSYRVIGATGTAGSLVVTGLPTATATATVAKYVAVEIAVAVVGLALAGLAGTVLVRRELRPLNRVAATATRVAELPLDRGEVLLAERVPEEDTDPGTEVGQVGAALNQMLGHIEQALAARHESETQVRQFVADASHELRTPLASIRGYAELVRRLPEPVPDTAVHAMARVESETKRMTGLVEDMLLLARLDAGRDLDRVEVDVSSLAVDAVADAHAAGPDHVWRLELDGHGSAASSLDEPDELAWPDDEGSVADHGSAPALALGDEARLRQVLANLLTNARIHTPPGTTVVVSVGATPDAVTLQVQDDGPGIPEPLRSRLFQRFTRGDASRNRAAGSSTGLGLAIVHAVVTAHGGSIEVDGTPGQTSFTVTLPAAP